MGIGLSSNGVNLNRLPGKSVVSLCVLLQLLRTCTCAHPHIQGWEKNSYGFHADDGCVFCSSGTGQQYGPTFSTADVVGCGFNLVDRSIFFTKNGINLGQSVYTHTLTRAPQPVHVIHILCMSTCALVHVFVYCRHCCIRRPSK